MRPSGRRQRYSWMNGSRRASACRRPWTNPRRSSGWIRLEERLAGGREGLGRDAEHLVGLRRPPERVVDDVEVEDAHLPGLERQRQPLAHEPQALLGQLALADVGHDAHQPLGPAVGLARHHQAAAGKPERRAVGADDPVFGDERVLPVGEGMEVRRQVAIVGMQRRLVLVGVAADLATAFGQVEPEQRHPFLRPGPGAGHEVGLPGPHPAGVEGGAVARFSLAQGGLDGVGGHPAGFLRQGSIMGAGRGGSQPLPTTALARFPPHRMTHSHRHVRPRPMGFGPGRSDHGATISPRFAFRHEPPAFSDLRRIGAAAACSRAGAGGRAGRRGAGRGGGGAGGAGDRRAAGGTPDPSLPWSWTRRPGASLRRGPSRRSAGRPAPRSTATRTGCRCRAASSTWAWASKRRWASPPGRREASILPGRSSPPCLRSASACAATPPARRRAA